MGVGIFDCQIQNEEKANYIWYDLFHGYILALAYIAFESNFNIDAAKCNLWENHQFFNSYIKGLESIMKLT